MLILTFLLLIVVLLLSLGIIRTINVQKSKDQATFLKGTVPENLTGFFGGFVENHTFSWMGKTFDGAKQRGINNFKENNEVIQKYPFKTCQGKGLIDKNLNVFKIDYNLKENPLWVRFILDEVVEVGKGKLLGKVNIKLFPGLSFSVGFFHLKK
jgi:hypothetical protein